ncbi:MAG: hypothetical protein ABSC19_07330 [Syntrophorhabdales bacterium]|jgi:hypothetical protein
MKSRSSFIKSIRKPLLLLFAAYMLYSVAAVAFDPDRVMPSKTCAICFTNNSLSSSLNHVPVLPAMDLTTRYEIMVEEVQCFEGSVVFTGLLYRGPPLPPRFG